MAEQTNLSNAAEIAGFLDSLGLFERVEESGGTITVTAAGGHTVATYANGTWTLYASENMSTAVGGGTSVPGVGYKCTGGAVLALKAADGSVALNNQLCICSNQDGVPIFAWHGTAQGGGTYFYDVSYRAVSYGDDSIGTYQTDQRIMNQDTLMPIITRPPLGKSSFSREAFVLYSTQTQAVQNTRLGSERYFTTGWFALKDEEAKT